MTRNVLTVMASVLVAGTLVAAQSAPAQDPAPSPVPQAPVAEPAPAPAAPAQDGDDQMFRGCLIQGSSPTTFILENAKLSASADAKAQSYLVEIQAEADQVQSILNSHVEVTGLAEKADAGDEKRDEKDLPKLTAKRITRLAETCPATGD